MVFQIVLTTPPLTQETCKSLSTEALDQISMDAARVTNEIRGFHMMVITEKIRRNHVANENYRRAHPELTRKATVKTIKRVPVAKSQEELDYEQMMEWENARR